jgi:hypothetical protein
MTVMDHINRIAPRELGAWLKERLADEMPVWVRVAVLGACIELAREFLSNPEAGTDHYAEELMRVACGIDKHDRCAALLSDEAHMLVAQSTFAELSKAKQVAVLSIVRKQPHECSYWTELDRRTDGKLRNVISYCVLDGGLAEFIRFMPHIVDEPPGADVLILLLETRLRHKAPADKEQLLQMIREVLPQCCASIRRAVAEWFQEEGIQA